IRYATTCNISLGPDKRPASLCVARDVMEFTMFRFDFTSQEYLRDPAKGLASLRAAGPIVQVRFPIIGKAWITTNSEMAGRVLKGSETFTLRKDRRVSAPSW